MNFEDLLDELLELTGRLAKSSPFSQTAGLAKGETFVLNYLADHETALPGELGNALEVSTARIASVLNGLEAKELVVRAKDTSDHRRIHVRLTEKGREQILLYRQQVRECLLRMLQALGPEDAQHYVRILSRIVSMSPSDGSSSVSAP